MMFEIGVLVAVLVAFGQALKKVNVPSTYLPFINIALGAVIGVVYIDASLAESIMTGIIIGLTASGLYDVAKVTK
ncbi:holin [Geomicrobium sp. JCM 19055]|uniref:holin n=1 Tax=Geomicrobium sp. JCM 19055 TaxID=1460649 RepID=UPI00045ED1F3|nr:holin [Geomicrobium sp. JCM 19055]GAK00899.1 hypothetical protein JCM19055_4022 [Geomicrobium sp. JCM 19055]